MQFNVKQEKIPELEWWDEFFVPQKPENGEANTETVNKKHRFEGTLDEKDVYAERVTHYV